MTKDEETSLKKFMEIGKLIQDYADLLHQRCTDRHRRIWRKKTSTK
jgi:hypothetical protein